MTAAVDGDVEPCRGVVASLGWAVFLGASWTWCIGMFLPVLLIRDYGLISWFVFAVPNVIGASAMGFVLRRQAQSPQLVGQHRAAFLTFSIVTVAFHGYFLGWLFAQQKGSALAAMALFAGMTGMVWVLVSRRRGMDRVLAACAWLGSLAALLWISHYRFSRHIPLPAWTVSDSTKLAWLAPVCLFGFALCPYLDLTFHRARQACAPATARSAFALGFGLFFLLMIAFTAVYADLLGSRYVGPAALSVLLWHILTQASLTSALHLREIGSRAPQLALLAGGIALVCFAIGGGLSFSHAGLSGGEIGYRVFMAFYGLVFPAYAWLCFGRGASRFTLGLLLVVVTMATPFYWLGFVERQEAWLAVGLLIVLLARLVPPSASRLAARNGPSAPSA